MFGGQETDATGAGPGPSTPTTDVLAYHSITDTWNTVGNLPEAIASASAVVIGEVVAIPGGTTKKRPATASVLSMIVESHSSFGWINYACLLVYMVALIGIGLSFVGREKTSDAYFLANRRIPWWAAGLSILATSLSTITFIAFPAIAFSMDWYNLPGTVGHLLVIPLVTFCYLPFFRRLNVTTAYEYLELRFNLPVRLLASAEFILFQLGRISVVLYLPAVVLSTVRGMNIYLCILSMGLLSTFYTVLGGVEAVIWTDVLQAILFFLGIIVALTIIVAQIGLGSLIETSVADEKVRIWYLDVDFSNLRNSWLVMMAALVGSLTTYTSDQTIVQRYLTTKDEQSAAKALWTSFFVGIPLMVLFFFLGAALYVFYKSSPAALTLGMDNDAIFPLFTVQRMPVGLAGLIVAAMFSASMSSLDSGMNSIATAGVTDFFRRFRPATSDKTCLNVARAITLAVDLAATGGAVIMVALDIQSIAIFFDVIIGLFGSGLAGLFFLAVFTRRVSGTGALVGAAASAAVLYYVRNHTDVNLYFYASIGFLTCVFVAYVVSLVVPVGTKSFDGLTIYSIYRMRR